MDKLIPIIPLNVIFDLLPENIRFDVNIKDIQELDCSMKKVTARKRFYRLTINEMESIHLTYGPNLDLGFRNTKHLNRLLPNYFCKSLFLCGEGKEMLQGQTFFDGLPIDESIERGIISEKDAMLVINEIRTALNALEKKSSISAWKTEYNEFKNKILKNPYFSDFDREFFALYLLPILEKGLKWESPTIRWSNGDLAARNILVNESKDFRIIDCEFAGETHFHDEDWLRLAKFSSPKMNQNSFMQNLIKELDPFLQVYFFLRQTILDQELYSKEIYKYFTSEGLLDSILFPQNFKFDDILEPPLFLRAINQKLNGSMASLAHQKHSLEIKKAEVEIKKAEVETEKKLYLKNKSELVSLETKLALEKDSSRRKQSEIKFLQNELNLEKEKCSKLEKDLIIKTQIHAELEVNFSSEKKSYIKLESQFNQEIEKKRFLEKELELTRDKVLRMQKSFSWMITKPLRFFRRIKERIGKLYPRIYRTNKCEIKSFPSAKQTSFSKDPILSVFEFPDQFAKHSNNQFTEKLNSKEKMHLLWLIPDFRTGSGGHTTIFRMIKWLESFGHKSSILICGGTHHGNPKKAKENISSNFFSLEASVDILVDPTSFDVISDIIISTSYDTCYYSRAIDSASSRFYFVQDYEPDFAPLGSYYFLAKETYSFGFSCITAGKWLASKVKSVGGMVSGYFELAVDKDIFFPDHKRDLIQKKIPHIAVYSRSATPRRMTELAILGLNILSRRGCQFKVTFFGDTKLPIPACFEFEIVGVAAPESLAELYRRADVGCVFSGTNYSLVPIEMMACGLPVLEFDGQNTRQTFPSGSIRYAKPNPISIADELEEMVSDLGANSTQKSIGLNYIKSLSWEISARKLESILRNNVSDES